MCKSCTTLKLSFQGHEIQVFADLSPFTIQKHRSLKPFLLVLAEQDIKYWWLFPFSLKFLLKNKPYTFASFSDREHLLLKLGILPQHPNPQKASSMTNSSKGQLPSIKWLRCGKKSKSKKWKETLTPWQPEPLVPYPLHSSWEGHLSLGFIDWSCFVTKEMHYIHFHSYLAQQSHGSEHQSRMSNRTCE